MNFCLIAFLLVLWTCTVYSTFVQGTAAANADQQQVLLLRQCANVHRKDLHDYPNATARFTQNQCALECAFESMQKSVLITPINRFQLCPGNPNGICNIAGQCVTLERSQNSAFETCAKKHNTQPLAEQWNGSAYSRDACKLACVMFGKHVSDLNVNDGKLCATSPLTVCSSGGCREATMHLPRFPQDEAHLLCSDIEEKFAQHNYNQPRRIAEFASDMCQVKCHTDDWARTGGYPINEGYPCGSDSSGICRNGNCLGKQSVALQQCSKLHNIDFETKFNSTGTKYINSQCALDCVVQGKSLKVHPVNEGSRCPANTKGVCRNGNCLVGHATTVKP